MTSSMDVDNQYLSLEMRHANTKAQISLNRLAMPREIRKHIANSFKRSADHLIAVILQDGTPISLTELSQLKELKGGVTVVFTNNTAVDQTQDSDVVSKRLEALFSSEGKDIIGPLPGEREGANEAAPAAAAAPVPVANGIAPGQNYLRRRINWEDCYVLNHSDNHGISALQNGGYVESDVDGDILINIIFSEPVKLFAIRITGQRNGSDPENIRLYPNKPNMNFSDVDDTKDRYVVSRDTSKGGIIRIKRLGGFQKVTSVGVYIVDNNGDRDTTVITSLQFIGQTYRKF